MAHFILRAALLSTLAVCHSARSGEIGPGFGVSGYSVTATADAALAGVDNTNTNPGGVANAFFTTGGVVGSSAIAGAAEASNYYNGHVYTSINGGFGATSASGSTLIAFQLSGAPANSVTQIELTFSETATFAAIPLAQTGSSASFSIQSTFGLDGQQADQVQVNANGLYQNSLLSSSGSPGLVGVIDPLQSGQLDLSGTSSPTVDATNSFAFNMDNSLSAEVTAAIAKAEYNVDVSAVGISNSAGVLPAITPIQPTPVPIPPSAVNFLSGLLLLAIGLGGIRHSSASKAR